MANIKIEDIIFWLVIAAIVGISLWLLLGYPPEINALVSIALFVVVSEILLWKAFFGMDKKVSMGFMKIKNDINNLRNELDSKFNNINIKLENIENLIKRKK